MATECTPKFRIPLRSCRRSRNLLEAEEFDEVLATHRFLKLDDSVSMCDERGERVLRGVSDHPVALHHAAGRVPRTPKLPEKSTCSIAMPSLPVSRWISL